MAEDDTSSHNCPIRPPRASLNKIEKNVVLRRTQLFEQGAVPEHDAEESKPPPIPQEVKSSPKIQERTTIQSPQETPPPQKPQFKPNLGIKIPHVKEDEAGRNTGDFSKPVKPRRPSPSPRVLDALKQRHSIDAEKTVDGAVSPAANAKPPLPPDQKLKPKLVNSPSNKSNLHAEDRVPKVRKELKVSIPRTGDFSNLDGETSPMYAKVNKPLKIQVRDDPDPETTALSPPVKPIKPPRTFAHDMYLQKKDEKRQRRQKSPAPKRAHSPLSNRAQSPVSRRAHSPVPNRVSSPIPSSDKDKPAIVEYLRIDGRDDTHQPVIFPSKEAQTKQSNVDGYEEVQEPKARTPLAKPTVPTRPKQLTMKISSPANKENIAMKISSPSKTSPVNRENELTSSQESGHHYEEIDATPKSSVDKIDSRTVQIDNKQVNGLAEVSRRKPPTGVAKAPPRPPAPTFKSYIELSPDSNVQFQLTFPSPKPTPESRWDKGYIKVKPSPKPKLSYVKSNNMDNPCYEKRNSIIDIKVKTFIDEDGNLKRYKSDECLYADPAAIRNIKHEGDVPYNPVYQDPMDAVNRSRIKSYQEDVSFDGDGYAIPSINRHTLTTEKERRYKKVNRAGTICHTTHNNNTWARQGIHDRLARNWRKQPVVREKVSRAYSVLRKKPPDEGGGLQCVPESDDSDNEVDEEEHNRRLVTLREKRHGSVNNYAQIRQVRHGGQKLFTFALIVTLERCSDQTYKTKVIYQCPASIPGEIGAITNFCFPDAHNWRPVTQYKSEGFSFVLTKEDGSRQYAYCNRILPPGNTNRLPEVYCIVSPLGAWNFYEQLLKDLEVQRQSSLEQAKHLLQEAYKKNLPPAGREVWIHVHNVNGQSLTTIMKRSADCLLEKVSFELLLKKLSIDNLLAVFSSLLLERRLIFIAQHLNTLSSCIHAVVSLLYPFTWQHTFVPILPVNMVEFCCAPTPFILGILTTSQQHLADLPMEEVLMIDIDNNRLLQKTGDEMRVIPKRIQKALKSALREDCENASERNSMVAEAFIRMFVETCGHYSGCVYTQQDGQSVFEREPFIKAISSKSIRMFLEEFSETAMFEAFMTESLETHQANTELFSLRVHEYREEMNEAAPTIKENFKEVGRRMMNFFHESGDKIKKKFAGSSNVYV